MAGATEERALSGRNRLAVLRGERASFWGMTALRSISCETEMAGTRLRSDCLMQFGPAKAIR